MSYTPTLDSLTGSSGTQSGSIVRSGGGYKLSTQYPYAQPQQSAFKAALPTTTYTLGTTSSIANAQTIAPIVSSVPNTANFYFAGIGLGQRNTPAPQNTVLEAKQQQAEGVCFESSFMHEGSTLDVRFYDSGNPTFIYVDDVFLDIWATPKNAGTASAGSSTTITLATGASTTDGFYNTYTVSISSGTGAGQFRQITGYVGSTLVATVPAWTTAPDATSVYYIADSIKGNATLGTLGSINLLNLNWGVVGTRKITVFTNSFYGVNIGPNDAIWPSSPYSASRLVYVGDSFPENTGGPFIVPPMSQQMSFALGAQLWLDGEGGTGWVNPATSLFKLNFMDRIAPPAESWRFYSVGATGGSYTLSLTYNGSTQTTAAINFNDSLSAASAKIAALSNIPSGALTVGGGGGLNNGANGTYPMFILFHNMPGALLTCNNSLTGGTSFSFGLWTGVVAQMVPFDGNGNAMPFILLVQGSGNDPSSFTVAQVQANATYTAQQIAIRFPTAIPIFTGVVSVGSASALTATDISFNTAIKTAAMINPTINGNIAYIETYPAGAGSFPYIFGANTVANPTNNTTDIDKSVTATGHPTGAGHGLLTSRLAVPIKTLFGAV